MEVKYDFEVMFSKAISNSTLVINKEKSFIDRKLQGKDSWIMKDTSH